jgi:hypothetical protein
MDAWSEACIAQNNNQNTYVANGKKYFWEIGRENRDGAITGTIWKYQPGDNGLVRRSGTFRIEGNGEVERAPKFLKDCTPTQEQLDAKEEEIRRLVTEKPMFEVA